MNATRTPINRHLLAAVRKHAFVDPATAAGGMPPGGDPAAMGGAPPGGMPPGGDPAAMGGAPPMDPSMAGSAPPGGDLLSSLGPMIQSAVQQALQTQGGGGAGGGGGQLKPKIDVNVALMQISKMLARICSALGVNIPAHELIATPQDLSAMAQQQAAGSPGSGGDASGGAGAGPSPTIQPIQPTAPAMAPPGGDPSAGKTASWQEINEGLHDLAQLAAAMRELR